VNAQRARLIGEEGQVMVPVDDEFAGRIMMATVDRG